MIQLKIYNTNNIRKYNGFTNFKDPYILENSLLKILNELFTSLNEPMEKEFNINNPRIGNLYFNYFTSSNFNYWGEYPLVYIYNDLIRHIQNFNINHNFFFTLESIFISYDEFEDINDINNCIFDYICDNYLNSYNYIKNNNNGSLVVFINRNDGVLAYILGAGFDPSLMCKWFCSSTDPNDMDSLPYTRYLSLKTIINTKKKKISSNMSYFDSVHIQTEMSDTKSNATMSKCRNGLDKFYISGLKKKSSFDTEIKYGNYPIDYNILTTYDNVKYGIVDSGRVHDLQNKMIKINNKKA